MAKKSVVPSIKEVAFDCPHCGAYTAQTWFDLSADQRPSDSRLPSLPGPDVIQSIERERDLSEETKARFLAYFKKIQSGGVFLERTEKTKYLNLDVENLFLSKCFTCGEIAVWVHDRPIFPAPAEGPTPNVDLPEDVLGDYEEASRIVGQSPRGAAALLRLSIQKLCVVLGEKGKNIDDDIASLVSKGLAPLVQKALDSVRVIGNEAVHPGTLDLKDDLDTARKLFALINIIAEQMISNPKHVEEIYGKLPEAKRDAIEKRDNKLPTLK